MLDIRLLQGIKCSRQPFTLYSVNPGSAQGGTGVVFYIVLFRVLQDCVSEDSHSLLDILVNALAACSDQIVAKDLDKTVYAAVVYESNGQRYSTGILPYSIAAYCREQAALPDSGMNGFATAAAAYGSAAKAYFG